MHTSTIIILIVALLVLGALIYLGIGARQESKRIDKDDGDG